MQTGTNKKTPEGLYFYLDARRVGCASFFYPHDIIENCCIPQVRIIEIIAPLYKENLSITEIAEQTGIKRTTVWTTLKLHEKELKSQRVVPFERRRKGHQKTGARPPYGFFQGEVVRDPKSTRLFF